MVVGLGNRLVEGRASYVVVAESDARWPAGASPTLFYSHATDGICGARQVLACGSARIYKEVAPWSPIVGSAREEDKI
jgi:hypothetical protein